MLGSSWHWNSPRFYLRQDNSPMNGALTTLKWMLMIIQLFTMAHLFLDGFPGLPIKFSSSPWAPKTWARIHLLWPVQVGSTHFFTWHRKISQCEFWKLLIQKKVLFTYMFAARKSDSAISPWWNLVKAPNEALAVWTIRPQPALQTHCCDLHLENGQELPDFAGKPHGSCFQKQITSGFSSLWTSPWTRTWSKNPTERF